jgi:4-hydroxybenzoyl-CoA thioesterase
MFSNRHRLRIRWGDCDPAGIVFYPRYFEYFNECTELLLDAAIGMPKREVFAMYALIGIPMVQLRARYLIPSRYGEEVTVESTFVKVGRSSFDIRHALMKGSDLAVEGFETRVWAAGNGDGTGIRAAPIPKEIASKLRGEAVGA